MPRALGFWWRKREWADMEVPSESFHTSSWDSTTCYPWRATNQGLTDDWLAVQHWSFFLIAASILESTHEIEAGKKLINRGALEQRLNHERATNLSWALGLDTRCQALLPKEKTSRFNRLANLETKDLLNDVLYLPGITILFLDAWKVRNRRWFRLTGKRIDSWTTCNYDLGMELISQ